MDNEVTINKKRKWKFLGISLFLILAIAVGLYIGYKKLNSNPSTIYKEVINKGYSNISKYLKEYSKNEFDININNEPFILTLNTNLDSNIEDLKTFIDKKYELKVGLDMEKKLATLGANINTDEENILDIAALLDNKNAYLKSAKLIDKIINLGEYKFFDELYIEPEFMNANSFTCEDFDYILKNIKNSYIASLDKKSFELTKMNVNKEPFIEDDYPDGKKITYTLDNDNLNKTLKIILNNIVKDDKMLEILSKIVKMSSDELKTSINEELKREKLTTLEYLETAIYVDNFNNFLGLSLKDSDDVINLTLKNDNLNLKISDENTSLIVETNNDDINIKFLENNESLIEFKINDSNSEDLDMDFVINAEESKLNGKLILNNIINTTDKVAASYDINIKTALDTNYLTLKGDFSLEKKELDLFDTSGTVKIDDLSEEEVTNMYVKIMDIMDEFGITDLLDLKGNI